MKPTAEQLARWQQAIEGLEPITRGMVPPHEQLPPTYKLGEDKVWRIKLADGRIGWAKMIGGKDPASTGYLVPLDVADEAWLQLLAQRGEGIVAVMTGDPTLRTRAAVLRASPERLKQLEAESLWPGLFHFSKFTSLVAVFCCGPKPFLDSISSFQQRSNSVRFTDGSEDMIVTRRLCKSL